MTFLSVIIPIYNASQYLDRCLSSILSQTYAHFECLLIDDGSTDASGQKCLEYANRDSRFRYYQQENGGVASARNYGLSKARGEWVCWVDADDYVSANYLSHLVASLQLNTDLVIHALTRKSKNIEEIGCGVAAGQYDLANKTDLELFFSNVDVDHLGVSIAKLFRLSLIREFDIQYSTNIRLAEDLDFLFRYLTHCRHIRASEQADYYYILREGSVSNTFCSHKIEYRGFQQISVSAQFLRAAYPIFQVDRVVGLTLAAYIHRVLLSCYKLGVTSAERFSTFHQFTKSEIELYKKYGYRQTRFLRSMNFLFCNGHYTLFDWLMLFVYRVRYPLK